MNGESYRYLRHRQRYRHRIKRQKRDIQKKRLKVNEDDPANTSSVPIFCVSLCLKETLLELALSKQYDKSLAKNKDEK